MTYPGPPHPIVRRGAALLFLALLLAVPVGIAAPVRTPGAPTALGAHPPTLGPSDVPYLTSTVYYVSSIDGFNLSYTEAVPSNYSSLHTYPLAIELHGLAGTEITAMVGGWPTQVNNTTVQAAIDAGFLLIIPNTRTGAGWYTDSPYTGPQQQDILDAIASEETRRDVGALYLYGFSMGGIGSLAIGLSHPGIFAGLGAIAMFSDMYQMLAYFESNGQVGVIDAFLRPVNGVPPENSTASQAYTTRLSALRYEARNASGTRMYFTDGAQDFLSTNNVSQWAYQQGNDSVLHATCGIAASLHQPANCTTPFAALAASDPANFSYRYIFEPLGFHAYAQLNATDLFAYFSGQRPSGAYWGDFPLATPYDPPQPLVTLATQPYGCGTITYDGRTVGSGSVVSSVGAHPLSFSACPGDSLTSVRTSGAVTFDPPNGTLHIAGSGSAVGVYAAPRYTVLIQDNAPCAVEVNGQFYGNGSTITVSAGPYALAVPACAMYTFQSWTTTGALGIVGSGSTATLNVSGNGTLTATFAGGPPPQPVAVTVLLDPPCSAVILDGQRLLSGSVVDLSVGSYPLQALDCTGYAFQGWTTSGGVTVTGAGAVAVLDVTATGSVTAVYQVGGPTVYTVDVFVSPSDCGASVEIDGVWYSNGWQALVPAQNYSLAAGPCSAGPLLAWNVTGGVAVVAGVLVVTGGGSVTAWFGNASLLPPNPPATNDSGGFPLLELVPVFAVAVGAVLIGAIVLGRRSAARRPPAGRPGRGDGPPPRR